MFEFKAKNIATLNDKDKENLFKTVFEDVHGYRLAIESKEIDNINHHL